MRKTAARTVALVTLLGAFATGTARADSNDLVMARLGTPVTDGAGDPIAVVGDNQAFRSLASEIGVVLAPRLAAPADTLGFGGFQFTADIAYTRIASDRAYWRALESSPEWDNPNVVHGDSFMTTVGAFVRKGIWLPVPSFELGAGVVHLLDSDLWAAQAYGKLALHEGYHDLPLPSVAVRGAVSRMMGSAELDLTIASVDVSASKLIGIANAIALEPYAGWNLLIIIPRSEVIDKTPHIDALATPGDGAMNFVFRDQDDIFRHRLFGGFKTQYYVFQITLEAAFALAGSSIDDRTGTDLDCADVDPAAPTAACDARDRATLQETYTISVGLDF